MAIHKAAEGIHADADPSVTFNRKSARMERQAPSKSPFTVIIMADAEELLHLNKQVNWIPIRMVRQFHLQHTRTKKKKNGTFNIQNGQTTIGLVWSNFKWY